MVTLYMYNFFQTLLLPGFFCFDFVFNSVCIIHRVSFGGAFAPSWLWLAPPLDMLRILFHMYLYKSFNNTINGKLCLCENSPRFHQIVSNKRFKIRGACPRTPLVCHNNSHISSSPPLGQKRNAEYVLWRVPSSSVHKKTTVLSYLWYVSQKRLMMCVGSK